jgi:hypothetical protein
LPEWQGGCRRVPSPAVRRIPAPAPCCAGRVPGMGSPPAMAPQVRTGAGKGRGSVGRRKCPLTNIPQAPGGRAAPRLAVGATPVHRAHCARQVLKGSLLARLHHVVLLQLLTSPGGDLCSIPGLPPRGRRPGCVVCEEAAARRLCGSAAALYGVQGLLQRRPG